MRSTKENFKKIRCISGLDWLTCVKREFGSWSRTVQQQTIRTETNLTKITQNQTTTVATRIVLTSELVLAHVGMTAGLICNVGRHPYTLRPATHTTRFQNQRRGSPGTPFANLKSPATATHLRKVSDLWTKFYRTQVTHWLSYVFKTWLRRRICQMFYTRIVPNLFYFSRE